MDKIFEEINYLNNRENKFVVIYSDRDGDYCESFDDEKNAYRFYMRLDSDVVYRGAFFKQKMFWVTDICDLDDEE
jgi:hypothetical protein